MVLFICRGNMFRSQIAEAFYNTYAKDGSYAESCGTWVEMEGNSGKTLEEMGGLGTAIGYMRLRGIDISNKKATPISPELVSQAERIYVMAEKDSWPDYLQHEPRAVFWEVKNPDIIQKGDAQRIGNKIEELIRGIL